MERGLVHLYWGDGKGKTTCALGLGLRVAGSGGGVLLAQFLKDNSGSERSAVARMPLFRCVPGPETIPFSVQMDETEKEKARALCKDLFDRAVSACREGAYRLLILDELCAALSEGFLEEGPVFAFLDQKPPALEVAITGRNPPPGLLARADYITHFQEEKHPYRRGVGARRGIEY
ncbi:MAG: cob(I)yrinic acid a,c-diamide adenosyltransferase [Oscillospiraceae bacterium]